MQIFIYNRFGEQIKVLTPDNGLISSKRVEEINGELSLEITTTEKLEKGYMLLFQDSLGRWHEYRVSEESEEREDALVYSYYAETSLSLLDSKVVLDKRPQNTSASVALTRALEGSQWSVGRVDNLGSASTSFYHISAREAIEKTAEAWQGEIMPRIEVSGDRVTGRYVDLKGQLGSNLGKRIEYSKDLVSIKREVHSDPICTRLYPYGKGEEVGDGFGRRIGIEDVNGGKPYIEDTSATAIWGQYEDGTPQPLEGIKNFDDIEDPSELLEAAQKYLEEVSQPKVSYEAKVIDLAAFGIVHEGMSLGDTVTIVDDTFPQSLTLQARVIKIEHDDLKPEETVITLGNFVEDLTDILKRQNDYINSFRSRSGIWDRAGAFSKAGKLEASYIDGLLAQISNDFKSGQSYIEMDEQRGIIIHDKPKESDSTWCMQLSSAGWRIARTRKSNGEWDWRTAATGKGLTADVINAGVLRGGAVNFDLENGSLELNTTIGGNNIQIILNAQEGLSIYSNGKLIGGLVVGSDGKVSNIANRLTNTVDVRAHLEVGKIPYTGLEGLGQNLKGASMVLFKAPYSDADADYLRLVAVNDVPGNAPGLMIYNNDGRAVFYSQKKATTVFSPGYSLDTKKGGAYMSVTDTRGDFIHASESQYHMLQVGSDAVALASFDRTTGTISSRIGVSDAGVVVEDKYGNMFINDWIKSLDRRISALGG